MTFIRVAEILILASLCTIPTPGNSLILSKYLNSGVGSHDEVDDSPGHVAFDLHETPVHWRKFETLHMLGELYTVKSGLTKRASIGDDQISRGGGEQGEDSNQISTNRIKLNQKLSIYLLRM